jgi:predicted DsbA family dithiol-disulfide isomerase
MRVEIVSDVVCPWCYIGKRRFDAALAMLASEGVTTDLTVSYRAFQLYPTAPLDDPTPVREAYAKKFGGANRAEQILATVTQAAAAEGLEFHMDIALRANTLRAHRLLTFVGREHPHQQSAVNEAIMRAYFTEGKDIADPVVLVACASSTGIDAERLLRVITGSDDDIAAAVRADLEWAAARDITAVPTFVINDSFAVPGAQDAPTFARLIKKMTAQ